MLVNRTYSYKMLLTKGQHSFFNNILEEQRQLYNAALHEAEDCYKKTGETISLYDRYKSLTQIRQEDEFYRKTPCNIQRFTAKTISLAIKKYIKSPKYEKKNGKGRPRYKSKSRFRTFGFNDNNGFKIKDNKIIFSKQKFKFHKHREYKGDIKCISFTKKADCWWINIVVEENIISTRQKTKKHIGIDLGLKNLLTTSHNEVFKNIKAYKSKEEKLKDRQRKLSKSMSEKKKKRNKDALGRLHLKTKNVRETHLHQVTSKLVRENDYISVEDIDIANMIDQSYKTMKKSIYDVAWGNFLLKLEYKAESAGVLITKVDPAYTSQVCHSCGSHKKIPLNIRVYECNDCGFVVDRDLNAAMNIEALGCSETKISKDQFVYTN